MAIDIEPTTILGPSEGIGEHPAVNLTHNTKGSAWNRIGNNELIDPDQWRYNYNPDTGIFEGRTIMGQWTNEIQDPRDMTTGNWTLDGVSAARDAVGIDGDINTASTITSLDDGGFAQVRDTFSATSGNSYVLTVYAKYTNTRYLGLILEDAFPSGSYAVFDLSNGTIDNSGGGQDSESIKDIGGGWYRLSIVVTANSTATGQLTYRLGDTSDIGSMRAVNDIELDVGSLFENRSSPPPTPVYGETAGQSYTQDPDIATVTDLDAINFNPSEGTFVCEFSASDVENFSPVLMADDGSRANRIGIYFNGSRLRGIVEQGDSIEFLETLDNVNNDTYYRAAISYKENDTAFAINGNIIASDTSVILPTNITTIGLGVEEAGTGANYNGVIRDAYNIPRRLPNEDLIQETTI